MYAMMCDVHIHSRYLITALYIYVICVYNAYITHKCNDYTSLIREFFNEHNFDSKNNLGKIHNT